MDSRVLQALKIIHSGLSLHLDAEKVARTLNLSSSRLRHLLKRDLGIPFGQYVKRARMDRAREILETSHLSVKQVMSEVGAQDRSHFTRDYKKIFGERPRESRLRASASLDAQKRLNAVKLATN